MTLIRKNEWVLSPCNELKIPTENNIPQYVKNLEWLLETMQAQAKDQDQSTTTTEVPNNSKITKPLDINLLFQSDAESESEGNDYDRPDKHIVAQ